MSAVVDLLTAHAYSDEIGHDCECGWVDEFASGNVQKAWALHVQEVLADSRIAVVELPEADDDLFESEGIRVSNREITFGMPISLHINGSRHMSPRSARDLAATLLASAIEVPS